MLNPESYSIVAHVFPRLLGLIYFFAIGAFLFQIRGLLGKEGILPASEYLALLRLRNPQKCYLYAPSLFWFDASDRTLMGAIILGVILSIFLMLGFYPALILFLLYCLYLSIVSIGQDFLSYGWEGFLLEVTVQAFFMSWTPIPNLMVWIATNVLLWRFHFQAGLVKLQSGDPVWRNLTAVGYHYQTQPIPNTIAWYAYKLPLWFQKFSTLMMFIAELVICFGIFGTEGMRTATFIGLFGLQFMIWLTGNFSYLNHLTAVFCIILLSNDFLLPWIALPAVGSSSFSFDILLSIIGALLLGLQIARIWNQFLPNRQLSKIFYWTSFFHIANRYGIFAVMTTKRYEIIIEGSEDRENWKE